MILCKYCKKFTFHITKHKCKEKYNLIHYQIYRELSINKVPNYEAFDIATIIYPVLDKLKTI